MLEHLLYLLTSKCENMLNQILNVLCFILLNKSLGSITRRFIEQRVVKAKGENQTYFNIFRHIVMASNMTKESYSQDCVLVFV